MSRRFPAPWTVEKIAGGFVVEEANGQSLAHVYADNRQIMMSRRGSRSVLQRQLVGDVAERAVTLELP